MHSYQGNRREAETIERQREREGEKVSASSREEEVKGRKRERNRAFDSQQPSSSAAEIEDRQALAASIRSDSQVIAVLCHRSSLSPAVVTRAASFEEERELETLTSDCLRLFFSVRKKKESRSLRRRLSLCCT